MATESKRIISRSVADHGNILRRIFSISKGRKVKEDAVASKCQPDEDMIRQLEIIQRRLYHDQMRMRQRTVERYNRARSMREMDMFEHGERYTWRAHTWLCHTTVTVTPYTIGITKTECLGAYASTLRKLPTASSWEHFRLSTCRLQSNADLGKLNWLKCCCIWSEIFEHVRSKEILWDTP